VVAVAAALSAEQTVDHLRARVRARAKARANRVVVAAVVDLVARPTADADE
jgi:hypothetical protein